MRFDDEACETGLGTPNEPDLTFTASAEDYLAAARGSISPDLLFDSGRLRVTGDEELLSRLADMFIGDQPAGQR
jgi:predicted lipid carrier protein YhbT